MHRRAEVIILSIHRCKEMHLFYFFTKLMYCNAFKKNSKFFFLGVSFPIIPGSDVCYLVAEWEGSSDQSSIKMTFFLGEVERGQSYILRCWLLGFKAHLVSTSSARDHEYFLKSFSIWVCSNIYAPTVRLWCCAMSQAFLDCFSRVSETFLVSLLSLDGRTHEELFLLLSQPCQCHYLTIGAKSSSFQK